MQTINWYYQRLKAMSPGEVAWRVQSCLRDSTDKLFLKQRQKARTLSVIFNGEGDKAKTGFHVADKGLRKKTGMVDEQTASLMARAEKLLQNRFTFFDLKDKFLGNPITWNRDHKLGKDTPLTFSPSIDYRDIREVGDCKFVWEPNRHHHLVVLARAYHSSGDKKYAEAVAEQIKSWLGQNPYGLGMNWRSGLELGIRLINWVWAFDLVKDSNVISGELCQRFMDSLSRHMWEIDRKYSRGSSANNHLVGEAAGVFTAASYFNNIKNASVWSNTSREILVREILNQTYNDGGNKEQAVGYHIFTLQFFIIAGLIARATKRDFPESYWSRLEKMFEFVDKLSEGGDNLPNFGDCDDGYVLDIGTNPHSVKEWLAVGAALFKRNDFNTSEENSEPLAWLPGLSKQDACTFVKNKRCSSVAFEQSGCYLLQYGELNSPERISVVFDCGSLGLGTLAAHGHADALSFTLRAFGKDILIDPGTYDYFSYPQWRDYFRSTRAHNTIVVDEKDQSEMPGLFIWGRKAQARCLNWQSSDVGGKVTGEHNGYAALSDPVIHRRTLELDGRQRILTIRDDIIANEEHIITIYFHLTEDCEVTSTDQNHYTINIGSETVNIKLDSSLEVELYRGSTNPISGWFSRGYHQKQPITTIAGKRIHKGTLTLDTIIEAGQRG